MARALRPLDECGGIAIIASFTAPAVFLLVCGAVDCAAIVGDRSKARSIAESAALAGARDLSVATGDAIARERAIAYAESQIATWTHGPKLVASVSVVRLESGAGIRVQIDGSRPSFFGTLLPRGGWKFAVAATATTMASTPLCVIAHGDRKGKVLEIKDAGRMIAPACLIHSNEDVLVDSGAELNAGAVQAVTSASGPIDPDATTDAPRIPDPFADVALRAPANCNSGESEIKLESGSKTLLPGVHCNKVEVYGDGVLKLAAGEHWFVHADLVVKENARVVGNDVALFFDKDSKFEFKDQARVALDGRESGLYAGFLLAATRDNEKDFIITSENVESLHGVIYIPHAQLIVEGKEDVARQSAWTVLIAERIQLKGNPSVYVNAGYAGSDVPVPSGVGPRGGGARLVQ